MVGSDGVDFWTLEGMSSRAKHKRVVRDVSDQSGHACK